MEQKRYGANWNALLVCKWELLTKMHKRYVLTSENFQRCNSDPFKAVLALVLCPSNWNKDQGSQSFQRVILNFLPSVRWRVPAPACCWKTKISIHLKPLRCAASTKIHSLEMLTKSALKILHRFAMASHERSAYKYFIYGWKCYKIWF